MDGLFNSLKLKIYIAMRSRLDTRWKVVRDVETASRLYYIRNGSGHIGHHGRKYKLKPGRVYLIPANSGFTCGCPDKVEIWWLHFSAHLEQGISLFDYLPCSSYEFDASEWRNAASMFGRLADLHKMKSSCSSEMESQGILLTLLAAFFKGAEPERRKNEKIVRLQPVLDYIEQNLKNKINVAELAGKVSLERAYFSTLFASIYGMPVHKYIINRRLETAKIILRNSTEKIDTIGRELGFSDGFHFAKVFRKHTGLTPREFRRAATVEPLP